MTNTKLLSIVAASSPEEPLMTVSMHVCDEASLPTTRYEQETVLATGLTNVKYAYMVLPDGPLDEEDMGHIASLLSLDIEAQATPSHA